MPASGFLQSVALVAAVLLMWAAPQWSSPAGVDPQPLVVAAAGDIACDGAFVGADTCHQRGTSDRILAMDVDGVLTLGDMQYPSGRYADYRRRYDRTWGRFLDITHPAPGNHEYETPHARGYFRYFGHPHPFYSFDLRTWHLVSLNSEIPMDEGTDQDRWLEQDLAATDRRCILAFWHRPLFASADQHAGASRALWNDLFAAHADVVLNGHQHNYERFARLSPGGAVKDAGVREFVVGTGGRSLYPFGPVANGSRFRDASHFGVLRLALGGSAYRWAFVGEHGVVQDRGHTECH
jgi:hypothetical protein